MLGESITEAADAKLSLRHVHRRFNVFQHIPCNVSNLPNPDLLHTLQIGMLEYLQMWIFHFMKKHEQLDKYNAIWLSLPASHHLTAKYMSYQEDSKWNGKGMKEMSRYLL
jgi:hypothetical protein